jgi:hypothetical protein
MTTTPTHQATRQPARRAAKILRAPAAPETGLLLAAAETSEWGPPAEGSKNHPTSMFALAVTCIASGYLVTAYVPDLVLPLYVLGVCLCLRGVLIGFTSAQRTETPAAKDTQKR